jgi:hypothetical protein
VTGPDLGDVYTDTHRPGRTFRVDLITVRAGKTVAVCTIQSSTAGEVTDERGGRITLNVKEFQSARYTLIEEA